MAINNEIVQWNLYINTNKLHLVRRMPRWKTIFWNGRRTNTKIPWPPIDPPWLMKIKIQHNITSWPLQPLNYENVRECHFQMLTALQTPNTSL